ncbi:MAG: 23S rRNA (adenine(2503)-C(2))-methyltransferase RlmN [Leptospirales bacterium]
MNNTNNKTPMVLDLDIPDWENFLKQFNYPGYRAKQVYKWLHNKNQFDFNEMQNIPQALKQDVQDNLQPVSIKMVDRRDSGVDGAIKIVWEFSRTSEAGNVSSKKIESVLIFSNERITVCVSTQAGCSLDCSFCATGKIPFDGNLSCGEIVAQVYEMEKIAGARVTNVVFMGMGEPFMNYDHTMKAAAMLSSEEGKGISARKITISTVGVYPRVVQYIEEVQPYNLAISVHTLDPVLRYNLVKAESKWPIQDLVDYMCTNMQKFRPFQVTLEYTLMKGVNMSNEDAAKLASASRRMGAKVNLIGVNVTDGKYDAPDEEEVETFMQAMKQHGATVFYRFSQGGDIEAACGMLRAKN